jgi:hypothetical protein
VRGVVAGLLVAFLVMGGGDPVGAEGPILPDGDEISFEESDGTISASLTIVNPTDAVVTPVELSGSDDIANCTFTAAPTELAANRSVTVKFTATGCELADNGSPATLSVGTQNDEYTLKSADSKPAELDFGWILLYFGIGGAASAITVIAVWRKRPKVPGSDDELPADFVLDVADDWKFSDSWATNLSGFAALFATLLGASDLLESVLGDEAKDLSARLLAIGVVSGLLIGAAPLVVKLFGPVAKPSVLGLLISGWLTMTGATGQIIAICAEIRRAAPSDEWLIGGSTALGVAGGVVLLAYAYKTLGQTLVVGSEADTDHAISETSMLAASIRAARDVTPPTPPSSPPGGTPSTPPTIPPELALDIARAIGPYDDPRLEQRGDPGHRGRAGAPRRRGTADRPCVSEDAAIAQSRCAGQRVVVHRAVCQPPAAPATRGTISFRGRILPQSGSNPPQKLRTEPQSEARVGARGRQKVQGWGPRRSQRLPATSTNTTTLPYGSCRGSPTSSTP